VATISGGAVNYLYLNNAGTGSNITLSGGGGSGAAGDMTQAFRVYVDLTSHNNQFIDLR
jgi:hypothetical protein